MIKNERQYKITKHQAKKFSESLANLLSEYEKNKTSVMIKAQVDAVKSQLADLNRQIEEYDILQQHRFKIIKTDSLEDLPRALVQARIAMGLSQKELAGRLDMKEQQIQRYEATDYASANLARIIEIANALGLKITKNIYLSDARQTFNNLFSRLKDIGFNHDFVMNRLVPSDIVDMISKHKMGDRENSLVLRTSSIIARIYGWSPSSLLSAKPLPLNDAGISARFKIPKRKKSPYTDAYIVYAHYLALLILEMTEKIKCKEITIDPGEVRKRVLSEYGMVSFETLLSYVWDLGIPILPLKDSGIFHGACWRVQRRNVIVLKQQSNFLARWAFDLLHELYHSGEDPEKDDFDAVDLGECYSKSEKAANRFAGDVLLDGRAEELTGICVKEANGKVELLKSAATKVARREKIELDYLANYLAFRLSLQNINWWGTASNLQHMVGNPWALTRDKLLQNINLIGLNDSDQLLLQSVLGE